jgi:subtilase family serine protease
MRRLPPARLTAALVTFAIGLSGCGGGSRSTSPVPPLAQHIEPNMFTGAGGFGYDETFVRNSQFIKRATFGRLGFDVAVRLQNPQGLLAYAAAMDRPGSTNHQLLTPSEVADRFMATSSDYAKATKYLQGNGLLVSGWPQRMLLHVIGTQAALEQAFQTKFGWYRHGAEQFIAPMIAPHVPQGVPIVGSANIVYRTKRYTPSVVHAATNGFLSGYSPQQIQTVFDYIGAYNVGYLGGGITIGIIGTGPVSVQSTGHLGDLDAMRAIFHNIGTNPLTVVSRLGSGFAAPPAVTAPCNQSSNPQLPPSESPTPTCNPEDGETQIDTEQTATLAPGANVQYYLDFVPSDSQGFSAQGLALADAEIADAIAGNTADILSLSFGGDEPSLASQNPPPFNSAGTGFEQIMFANAVAQGMSIFVSSGDLGANACMDTGGGPFFNNLCVSYPATDTNVTAVGGVTTPLDSAGRLTGPIVAWGQSTSGGFGGTGGGISAYIPQPSYQQGVPGMLNTPNCAGQPCRNVPDLSLEGDPHTGVAVVIDAFLGPSGQVVTPFGGTSVAAPEMAAMWALVLNACKVKGTCIPGQTGPKAYRTGLANPFFYLIYTGKATQSYALTFYDVLYGSNGQQPGGPTPGPTFDPGYNSGTGYDQTTGVGVPFARSLVKAITGI